MQKFLPKVRMQVSDATVMICFSSKLFWKQVTSDEKVFFSHAYLFSAPRTWIFLSSKKLHFWPKYICYNLKDIMP